VTIFKNCHFGSDYLGSLFQLSITYYLSKSPHVAVSYKMQMTRALAHDFDNCQWMLNVLKNVVINK